MKIQLKFLVLKNKGFIKEGYDADFTIVDMNKKIVIENKNIESKCGGHLLMVLSLKERQ